VEVRLSERAGEVRVAVRTPDGHLAGALRENLPELATRFAESGLRSAVWRPADSPVGERRHLAEMPAGSPAQDADSQSRGNGGDAQGDAQQRHQRNIHEPKTHKEKGKDFAWLMSSLR
jgi:flagellar hook-length control protein FliK